MRTSIPKKQFIDFKFGQDNGQGREPVKILGEELQRVHHFKYLGSSVEAQCKCYLFDHQMATSVLPIRNAINENTITSQQQFLPNIVMFGKGVDRIIILERGWTEEEYYRGPPPTPGRCNPALHQSCTRLKLSRADGDL